MFSVHDDLSYRVWDSKSSQFGPASIPSVASVSYLLVGYYNIPAVDPFFSAEGPLNTDLFKKFRMKLLEDHIGVLNTVAPPHLMLVCHGELNNVLWNEKTGPKKRVANEVANRFRTAHLLSVGEELIDAVSAWFANTTDPKLQKLAKAFKNLQLLAHNPGDHDEVMLKTTQQTNTAFEPAD